jgi:hypothetical protein
MRAASLRQSVDDCVEEWNVTENCDGQRDGGDGTRKVVSSGLEESFWKSTM